MNWFIDVFKNKYAQFDGRAGRPEYWFFILFHLIAIVVLMVLYLVLDTLGSVLFLLYSLAALVPLIAVTARRLHDTNRSGWWQLIALVPVVGLVLLVFTVLEGTPGNNNFGPPAPTSPSP
jgi:uncharacterized membrane protein YhaH (DUF805 family)